MSAHRLEQSEIIFFITGKSHRPLLTVTTGNHMIMSDAFGPDLNFRHGTSSQAPAARGALTRIEENTLSPPPPLNFIVSSYHSLT